MTERFAGTDRYIATEDLMMAVNAAVTLGRPLLIKGEPGTGKTQLAQEIPRSLGPCLSGTSSRPARRNKASMSTTRSRACGTLSWARRASTISPTTF